MTTREQARAAGDLIHAARTRRSRPMTQEEVVELMGRKDRNWIRYVERGERQGGSIVELTPAEWYHLSSVVGAKPYEVLDAAGVPRENWPNVSNMRSNDGTVGGIDTTGLSDAQATLVHGIIEEFRRINGTPGGGR